jgi:hypothetical protein
MCGLSAAPVGDPYLLDTACLPFLQEITQHSSLAHFLCVCVLGGGGELGFPRQ